MTTRRLCCLAVVSVALTTLAGAGARAQMGGPTGGGAPPMPMAVNIRKVAVGSWGQYGLVVGGTPPMKMKCALVARDGGKSTIEMLMEGGMAKMMGGRVVMQIITEGDPSNPDAVRKAVMQLGDDVPMDIPTTGGAGPDRPFKRVDPKKLVGKESVKVAAGTFKTEHYRDKTLDGGQLDAWVSKDVWPIGLVKMTITPPARGPEGAGKPPTANGVAPDAGSLTIELTGTGKNATRIITRPAKPFDQEAMMRAVMGAAGGAGANGSPPSAPSAPAQR